MDRSRTILGTTFIVLVILLLVSVIARQAFIWNQDWLPMDLTDQLLRLIVTLILVAMVVRLVLGIVYGHRPHHKRRRDKNGLLEDDALGILDRRYAHGKLTQEQYSQMKGDISSNNSCSIK